MAPLFLKTAKAFVFCGNGDSFIKIQFILFLKEKKTPFFMDSMIS